MDQDDYNRLRGNADFLESLLTVLVIGLFVFALLRPEDELLIALAVVIGGVLLRLCRQHDTLNAYDCPACGESPHRRADRHDPATPHCLHCGQRLGD